MASLYDSASLVMIPSGVKEDKLYSIKPTDGSGDFTFSRGSDIEATRVNSSGLIEKAKVNLLTYSEDFSNAAWVKNNSTFSGDTLTANAGTSYKAAFQLESTQGLQVHYFDVAYVDHQWVQILVGTGGSDLGFVNFDIQNKVIGSSSSVIDAAIQDFGTYLRLVYVVNTANKTAANIAFIDSGSASRAPASSSTGSFKLFRSQINHGLVAQDYVETTTTAVVEGLTADLPRLDYSGGASCPSLLLEPSRSNLVENSEYFNGASWTFNNVVITDNATTSPEGVVNASKWVATSGFSLKSLYEVPTCASGVAHTATAYFKAEEYPLAFIRLGGIDGNPYVLYDLRDESLVGTSALTSHDIQSVGNDWYRIEATATTTTTLIAPNIAFLPSSGYTLNANNIPEYTGDGTSGGYLYGAQVESGSYPTSYIPTYGTAANRGADNCQKTGIGSLIGNEFTLFYSGRSKKANDGVGRYIASKGTGGLYNSFVTIEQSGSNLNVIIIDSGSIQRYNVITPLAFDTDFKIAARVESGNIAFYLNGTQISVSNATFSIDSNTLYLGYYVDGGVINTSVNQAVVFPTGLTNAELAALTA